MTMTILMIMIMSVGILFNAATMHGYKLFLHNNIAKLMIAVIYQIANIVNDYSNEAKHTWHLVNRRWRNIVKILICSIYTVSTNILILLMAWLLMFSRQQLSRRK